MHKEQIQFQIDNLNENLTIEVKNWLGGLSNNDEKSKLAKEIIALANGGGGYIFIGFDDTTDGHPEIEPNEGEREAFTQDNIASLVQRYLDPPCQCEISLFCQTGSNIQHPVIKVPGEHRTPVWAKRDSPDHGSLKKATVYVRRPGGCSEPAQTQDDWEKLIDRLVKARQIDQLDAIREIINPSSATSLPTQPDLETWNKESYAAWQTLLEPLPADSSYRLLSGHWTFSFAIEPFSRPSLADLNRVLEREIPKFSGWPPFTYLHREPKRPTAQGNIIQAWLAGDPAQPEEDPFHSDFWRISRDGLGFLLRPMQEDQPTFGQNRSPKPQKPLFDWVLPIYRATELFKYTEALALHFSDEKANFSVFLKYYETSGRSLYNCDFNLCLNEDARCAQPFLESQMTAQVSSIQTNIEELVHTLLLPIFEQFEFQELPKALVDNIVKKVLSSR